MIVSADCGESFQDMSGGLVDIFWQSYDENYLPAADITFPGKLIDLIHVL
jgi:hypothetical protein